LIVWNSPIFNLIGTKYHRAVTTLEMVVLKWIANFRIVFVPKKS
jgi:hypothetical protein